ncbi:hypothetical protein BCR35DRAFT_354020 [Leucosporidium creatinivorum]|uniref:Uncharacterized protein n=1 Tax=Leucosporidium creatinivorum TaxID=106004 RepID=A0A1Y2ERF4_9BASI|nr:hypothetical protein BCR35DRAFT_354020 [Leucosporidium creatinivorum]
MYHAPLPTGYSYPAHLPQDDFGASGHQHLYQAAYPSPPEPTDALLLSSLYPSPTLYSAPDSELELFGEGIVTPASLYHSPIFEEAQWIASAPSEDVIEGVARQHALELELNLGALEQQVASQPSLWEMDPEPIPSAVPSYTTATLSPSPTPSSPLSSPASSAADEEHQAPSFPTCEQQHDFQPPTSSLSEHYTTLTTLALANRLAHGILPPSKPDRTSSTSTDGSRRPRPSPHHDHASTAKPLARSNKEGLACSCSTCGISVAQLNFRGKGDTVDVPLIAEYWCLACAPPESGTAKDDEVAPVSYNLTLSGVLDGMQGAAKEGEDKQEWSLRRMRPGMEKEEGVLTCDVCKLLVGSGSLRTQDPDDEIEFGVEVVCSSCVNIYSRCSDCGGGGGPRLGVGKWRCKELFAGGRKTCVLSHLRLGSLEEMGYDCWRISDLPPSEVDELISLCKELHYSTLLQTLATPDSLEAAGAIASTYDQVHKLAVDGWTVFEPLLRKDIEKARSKRRYIALRWSTPIPRKKAKVSRALAKRERTQSAASTSSGSETSSGLLRPGKKIVGFVLGEWDLSAGTLFLPLIMPFGSVGDTYEATTNLLQHLSTRVYADLDAENEQREEQDDELLPELKETWTMTLFTKDPRGVNPLESRRGFSAADKYALSHPQSDATRFSPLASGLLPPELTSGWQVYVRRVRRDDDWSAKTAAAAKRKASTSSGSGRDAGRAKKSRK